MAEIRSGLELGVLGGLDGKEARELEGILKWLTDTVNPGTEFALNKVPDAARLDVFTVNSDSGDSQFCGRGNAVFDASIDAIFLDIELFRQSFLAELFEGLADDRITSVARSYLYFIILHELGHREMHGTSGALFDWSGPGPDLQSLKREKEADRFAVDQIQEAYYHDESERHVRSAADSLYLEPVGGGKGALIDLAAMADRMSLLGLFTDSPYSSFFSDLSHPTFLDRSLRILDEALSRSDLASRERAHLSYSKEALERVRLGTQRLVAEIDLPTPAISVALDKNWLAGVDKHSTLYLVSLDKVEQLVAEKGHPYLSLTTQGLAPNIDDPIVKIWFDAGERLFGLTEGGSLISLQSESWRISDTLAATNSVRKSFVLTLLSEQGALITEAKGFEEEAYHWIRGGRVVHSCFIKDLEGSLRESRKPHLTSLAFEPTALTAARLTGIVRGPRGTGGGWQVIGVGQFDLKTCDLLEFHRLMIDQHLLKVGSWGTAASTPGNAGLEVLIFNAGSDELGSDVWTVWDVRPPNYRSSTLTASHRSMVSFLETDVGVSGEMAMSLDATFDTLHNLPDGGFLASYSDDSVYLLDPDSGSFEPVFHPGGLEIAIGTEGRLVAFYDGEYSRRLLLMDMEGDKK